MAKRHDFSKAGIVIIGLLATTAMAAPDALITNVRTLGRVTQEAGCVVQTLSGGTVRLFDCTGVGTTAPAADGSVSGD